LITIVCCIGNREIFDKYLGKSLKEQTVPYKFIEAPMDLSLPASYNSILDEITTSYVAFFHMDVLFLEKTWLERAERFCNEIPNLGVAGLAGKTWGDKCSGYIIHGYDPKDPRYKSTYYGVKYPAASYGNHHIKDAELSQTLDDLCLIIPTKVFKQIQFDENILQELGVDYCLAVKHQLSLNSFALPLKTWHNPIFNLRDKAQNKMKPVHGYTPPFHGKEKLLTTQQMIKNKWKGIFNLIFATVDIDDCPRCKHKPCKCKYPLTMAETMRYNKPIPNLENKAVFVVGMHRSGTSAMMGILRILGVDIGNPERLKHKDRWNEKGYLENPDFQMFERRLIGEEGWRYIEREEAIYKKLDSKRNEFKAIVAKYNRSPLWSYKAIRSMIFPKIFEMIPNIHFVVMIRNPESIAKSLGKFWGPHVPKKGRMLGSEAFRLYGIYYFRFLRWLSRNDYPYIFVNYDDLVDNAEVVMRKVANFIGVQLTKNHIKEGKQWIEKRLRHQ